MIENRYLEVSWRLFGGVLGTIWLPKAAQRVSRPEKGGSWVAPGPPCWTTVGVHFRSISVPDRFLVVFLMSFFEYHFFIDFR